MGVLCRDDTSSLGCNCYSESMIVVSFSSPGLVMLVAMQIMANCAPSRWSHAENMTSRQSTPMESRGDFSRENVSYCAGL
jgi:hypothetical protein